MAQNRGFTLVEVVVALVLTGLATAAIGSALLTGLRSYTRQIDRGQVRADLRTATAIFTRELRGLDACGGDIVEMQESTITYRAQRGTHFVCTQPNPSTGAVVVFETPSAGLRQLETGRDSLLLLAENDVVDPNDDEWIPLGLGGVSTGTLCPGGQNGLRLDLLGASARHLSGVYRGAVALGFQVTKILLYSASDGRYWIGLREFRPDNGWTITQPILGPVSRNGLRFRYYRADGSVAENQSSVALISVEIVRVGNLPAGSHSAAVRDSMTIHVGLRNNPGF